ncbi:ferredoxin reductase family protein [Cryobacterium tagatosivorans]|nr:hypothetical protein [Cryobacterium tagatosivorans]
MEDFVALSTEPAPHRPHYRGSRLDAKLIGPLTIAALVSALAVLWVVARPSGEGFEQLVGEWLGAEGVLLLSIGLVLISTLRWVERWFNGVDHAALWHRRVNIAGMLAISVHALVTGDVRETTVGPTLGQIGLFGLLALTVWAIAPRWLSFVPQRFRGLVPRVTGSRVVRLAGVPFRSYAVWRFFHRFTGVFVAAGFVHGLLDASMFDSAVLRWTYLVIGGTGLAFYVYRELLARRFARTYDYQVDSVQPIGANLVEISLKPLGRRFEYRAGQFAILYLEAKDGWHRHPFSIASAPADANVRVAVGALGDFTSNIADLVEPGMPAVINSPHGHFDYRRGTDHQAWIAGGIGVAPILSWLRDATSETLPARVDLYFSSRGPAPYGDEIRALSARHDAIHLHLIDTSTEPRLTVEDVLTTAGCSPRELSAFICGPEAMVSAFQRGLVRAGARAANVHREYFNLR